MYYHYLTIFAAGSFFAAGYLAWRQWQKRWRDESLLLQLEFILKENDALARDWISINGKEAYIALSKRWRKTRIIVDKEALEAQMKKLWWRLRREQQLGLAQTAVMEKSN